MTHGLSLTVGKWIEGVVSCGLLDFLLCSVGDLNPILGFYFPLFSRCFPREFPSRWKSAESSGSKGLVFFGESAHIFYVRFKYLRAVKSQEKRFLIQGTVI
jgi:hypothetical protein